MKVIAGEQPELAELELPYAHYSDRDVAQRHLYVEASRGCPYQCEFCLSALDKTAWPFELERLLAALATLFERGARQFRFVDRTFNLRIDLAVRILDFFSTACVAQMARYRSALTFSCTSSSYPIDCPIRSRP
jgi:radical SAM superfamily enzyme YgiQ (UPF0313 family)